MLQNEQGGDDPSNIPQEDIPLVLNSIVCEALVGFTRTLGEDNQWHWEATGEDGSKKTELFDLVNNDALAQDMLVRFCQAQTPPFGAQMNFIPRIEGQTERAMWTVYLMAPDVNKQPQIRQHTSGNRLGLAIALALCGMVEGNLVAQHRLLFPGKYLAIAN